MRWLVPSRDTWWLAVLVASTLFLVSCTRQARIYNLTTGEVTEAHYSYGGSGKGKIWTTLKTGEMLKGEYVTIAGGQVGWGSIFGSVYGKGGSASGSASGYTVSTEAKQRGTAILTGDKGTIVTCEYVTSAWNGAGTGACKDNHDVLYKLMF